MANYNMHGMLWTTNTNMRLVIINISNCKSGNSQQDSWLILK